MSNYRLINIHKMSVNCTLKYKLDSYKHNTYIVSNNFKKCIEMGILKFHRSVPLR